MKTPIPNWWNLPAITPSAARGWLAYPVDIQSVVVGTTEHPCFVERGNPRLLSEGDVGSELFNHDLLKCDVSSLDSLHSFACRYGIAVSPLYEGHQRLTWFRNRGVRRYEAEPSVLALRKASMSVYADMLAAAGFPAENNAAHPVLGSPMEDALTPALISEVARAAFASDREVVGVVSVLEVAQTVRLLQCATALVLAFQAECELGDDGSIERACAYLRNPRFLRTQGVRYFFMEDLLPYDERLSADKEFAAEAGSFEKAGGFPRVLYAESQIEALYDAASSAQMFLANVCRAAFLPHFADRGQRAGIFRRNLPKAADLKIAAAVAERGSLTEAIARQFLATSSAEHPWQTCEYCGRHFKRAKEANPEKGIRRTRFCCRSCNVSFNRKNAASQTAERDREVKSWQ